MNDIADVSLAPGQPLEQVVEEARGRITSDNAASLELFDQAIDDMRHHFELAISNPSSNGAILSAMVNPERRIARALKWAGVEEEQAKGYARSIGDAFAAEAGLTGKATGVEGSDAIPPALAEAFRVKAERAANWVERKKQGDQGRSLP